MNAILIDREGREVCVAPVEGKSRLVLDDSERLARLNGSAIVVEPRRFREFAYEGTCDVKGRAIYVER